MYTDIEIASVATKALNHILTTKSGKIVFITSDYSQALVVYDAIKDIVDSNPDTFRRVILTNKLQINRNPIRPILYWPMESMVKFISEKRVNAFWGVMPPWGDLTYYISPNALVTLDITKPLELY